MMNSRINRFSEEKMREVFENAYKTHFQYAPHSAKVIWDRYVKAIFDANSSEIKKLRDEIEECANLALDEFCSVLEEVEPRAALELLHGECNDRWAEFIAPRGSDVYSLGRCAWLIGVFGSGQNSSQLHALKAYNKYVRWLAAHLMKIQMDLLLANDDGGSASRAVIRLEVNRITEPETRMMWISSEITISAGRWAEGNSEICAISNIFNTKVAERINRNVEDALKMAHDAYVNKLSSVPMSFSAALLSEIPCELIEQLTASRRSISPNNVRDVINSDEMKFHPFVKIDGVYRVLQRSCWLFEREDALLHLCVRQSRQDVHGKVFEDVAAVLLDKWGPFDVDWSSSVDLISVLSGKRRDDVDVFGMSSNCVFIGECKANRLSQNNMSAIGNFESVVLNKAVSQLGTRVAHWEEGWRPSDVESECVSDVVGFIVTFSSYGGLLWDAAAIEVAGEKVQLEFSIFPLHSLVLAVAALKTSAQLKEYLNSRLDAMVRGVINFDELEHLFAYVSGMNKWLCDVPALGTVLSRQYELNGEGVSIDPRKYRKSRNWKNQYLSELLAYSVPLTPPV
ncbi:hypothetical protein [Actinomyces sp.]